MRYTTDMINLDKKESEKQPMYYAMIDGEQRGPFPLEELAAAGVRPSTYVWCDGMEDWEKAEDVGEVCRVFRNRIHDLMHPGSVAAEQRREAPQDFGQGGANSSPTRYDRYLDSDQHIPTLEEMEAQEDHNQEPGNWIVLAVVAAIFFSPILGGVAIYYAIKSRKAWKKGEKDQAYDYQRSAKMWIGITFFIGIIMVAFVLFHG